MLDEISINAILMALTAAGAAGVTAGVQDVAGQAVKGSYRTIVEGVRALLHRGDPLADGSGAGQQLTADELVAAFQAEPAKWADELRRRLATAPAPGPELESALAAVAGPAEERPSSIVAFVRDNIGVQFNSGTVRNPVQHVYPPPTRVDAPQKGQS